MIQSENSNTLPVDADHGQNVSGTISNVDVWLTPSDSPDVHGWQPIDTAPKDRWILVWAPGSNVRNACWFNIYGRSGWTEGGKILPIQPTHWQPLPAPPVLP